MMICKEFIGKVVTSFTIYEDGPDGPEICIEFTDGTVFSSCLKTSTTLEAKLTRDDGGRPLLVKDFSTLPTSR
jgi:hypothetical protein